MTNNQVLQWEMYGPGTAVAFVAVRQDEGYDLRVTRDEQVLVRDVAPDTSTLMRKSSDLRSHLQWLGFAPKPTAPRTSLLGGGVCWGPAGPMPSSMLKALR
jgi:hypothetical protein